MKKNVKRFFLLTGLAVGTVHSINRFIDMTAEMKNILKTETGEYYDWKNGQIYYTKRGTGSPVLLIHDLDPVASSYEWCRIMKKLEKKHTVYTLDLLGCGRSDKPFLTYTSYLYVQLITDFIQTVIGEAPDVITTNRSISFVVLAQNLEQSLMKRIIAINPPISSSFNMAPYKYSAIKKHLFELPVVGTFTYNVLTSEKNIKKKLCHTYFSKSQLVSSKMLDAYYEAAHIGKSHGKYLMASIKANYIDNNITHALTNLTIPLCIIESRKLRKADSVTESYTKYNHLTETAYISNAGLIPQLEVPEKLLNIMYMFLSEK